MKKIKEENENYQQQLDHFSNINKENQDLINRYNIQIADIKSKMEEENERKLTVEEEMDKIKA